MKKFFSILVLVLCASNIFAQKRLYNDIVYPDGETKGITSITYWNKSNLYYYLHNNGGGLTYSDDLHHIGVKEGFWYGWDYNHYGDYSGFYENHLFNYMSGLGTNNSATIL